jgi:hypothetical protein
MADADRTHVVKDVPTLEAIRNIEMAGRGRFYIDGSGNLRWESRYARSS